MAGASKRRTVIGARVALSLLLGGIGGVVSDYFHHGSHQLVCDFTPVWLGARALLHSESPYVAVRAAEPYPLYYPVSALLIGLPFAAASRDVACAAFAFVAVAILAFALSALPWRLCALASASCIHAVGLAQWSPLATAAYHLPALSALWALKPQSGIPVLLAWPTRLRAGIPIGLALVVVSVALSPGWPLEWLQSLKASGAAKVHVPPLLRPGGVLLFAAALRWRRPEARWLLGLAALPQTSVLYETLPLFVIPARPAEMILLVALSWVALVLHAFVPGPPDAAGGAAAHWPIILVFLWLPALIMVLRRPNAASTVE